MSKRFFRRRFPTFLIIVILVLADSGVLYAMTVYEQMTTKQNKEALSAQLASIDQQAATARTKRRLADEAAAAKKASEEAAAKKAAEEAAKQAAAGAAASKSPTTTCKTSGPHSDPASIDVVVNKKHCINPLTYTPGDLVTVYGATVSSKASGDLTAMFNAASAVGLPLSVTSSYRSYANQVDTYNYWVTTNGSTAAADTVSARPGFSEHQTGFAFDVSAGSCSLECFRGTQQYMWLQAHAAEYGFVERYPAGFESVTGYSAEAWHYRYVGTSVAQDMKAKSIKTLEQYWNVSGGSY